MSSEMQEIIAHSTHKAFQQGVIRERERILVILDRLIETIEGGEDGQDGIPSR
jgi:hypothetical protein